MSNLSDHWLDNKVGNTTYFIKQWHGTWVTVTETTTEAVVNTYQDTGPVNPNQKVLVKAGANRWGLNSTGWNLSKAAADYYILHLATIYDEERFKPYLARHTDILVDQFSRYTDMAVGGELRHSRSTDGFARPLKEALRDGTVQGGRTHAWEGWYWFRSRYGVLALKWAVEAFNDGGKWGASYGGHRWGTIANTLYMFERDETTPQTFVDTCWGLQHNGGIYFNKWWNTQDVKYVLDLNQNGSYCKLWYYSSHIVQGLLPLDTIKEEMCQCYQCESC